MKAKKMRLAAQLATRNQPQQSTLPGLYNNDTNPYAILQEDDDDDDDDQHSHVDDTITNDDDVSIDHDDTVSDNVSVDDRSGESTYAADENENIAIDAAEQNENQQNENLAIEYMPDVHDDTPNVHKDDNSNVEDDHSSVEVDHSSIGEFWDPLDE
jgi:hypothetical protein